MNWSFNLPIGTHICACLFCAWVCMLVAFQLPLSMITLCCVVDAALPAGTKGWLMYPSSCLKWIVFVSQCGKALYFCCHGVPSIIDNTILLGGMTKNSSRHDNSPTCIFKCTVPIKYDIVLVRLTIGVSLIAYGPVSKVLKNS